MLFFNGSKLNFLLIDYLWKFEIWMLEIKIIHVYVRRLNFVFVFIQMCVSRRTRICILAVILFYYSVIAASKMKIKLLCILL